MPQKVPHNDDDEAVLRQDWDFTRPGEYVEATKYYAGPFGFCGDYSCAAMRDEHANCSRAEAERSVGWYYPRSTGPKTTSRISLTHTTAPACDLEYSRQQAPAAMFPSGRAITIAMVA